MPNETTNAAYQTLVDRFADLEFVTKDEPTLKDIANTVDRIKVAIEQLGHEIAGGAPAPGLHRITVDLLPLEVECLQYLIEDAGEMWQDYADDAETDGDQLFEGLANDLVVDAGGTLHDKILVATKPITSEQVWMSRDDHAAELSHLRAAKDAVGRALRLVIENASGRSELAGAANDIEVAKAYGHAVDLSEALITVPPGLSLEEIDLALDEAIAKLSA